jgi:hypothetical protein
MNDDAQVISAAARSCGIPSEVLPMQNERDRNWEDYIPLSRMFPDDMHYRQLP